MSALERIAELHRPVHEGKWAGRCKTCHLQWPCPTRRLVDEAADDGALIVESWCVSCAKSEAQRDLARADADRLAAALRWLESEAYWESGNGDIYAALAAHDATRTEEGL